LKVKKPLYLHDREASGDMIYILKNFMIQNNLKKINGLVHCFTGDYDTMRSYLDLGLYIGVTGWICDNRRNHDLVEAVKKLPLNKLLIETDSPFLSPPEYVRVWKTKRNEPDSIDHVVFELSKLMNKTVEEIYEQTMINTKTLFNLTF
jgi:TatD DNase family protein